MKTTQTFYKHLCPAHCITSTFGLYLDSVLVTFCGCEGTVLGNTQVVMRLKMCPSSNHVKSDTATILFLQTNPLVQRLA